MINLLCGWMESSAVGFSHADIEKLIVEYLKEVIAKHFDPRKADDIFVASNMAPQWLGFMTEHAEWRHLIYQLSE